MKLRQDDFSDDCHRSVVVLSLRFFPLSLALALLSKLAISQRIRANYPAVRRVIGAARPFSASRANLHVLGEMSKEHGDKTVYRRKRGGKFAHAGVEVA